MNNDMVDLDALTDETKKKLRDFNEDDAYFLLCEIFSNAQATKDYAKFQFDLAEWKKRFPIELFSEEYARKIKYMLSNEFLEAVLKDFLVFQELSQKDPQVGLNKMRKIFDKAEKHKDAKVLDSDLDKLYKEYPLSFLKEKYPHIIKQLLSGSYREKILQKFNEDDALKELNEIVLNPGDYKDEEEYVSAISEWQRLFPIADFKNDNKDTVQKTLEEGLDKKRLEEFFSVIDLSEGTAIPLEIEPLRQDKSLIAKDALYDFFKIVDSNKGDIDSLFDWSCKYAKYINSFDENTKSAIVENLMSKYGYELPPIGSHYAIPKMESGIDDELSLSEYSNITDTKRLSVLQLLGILSTGNNLTPEDIYRLNTINANVKKVDIIENAKIDENLNKFIDTYDEDKLTTTFLDPISSTSVNINVDDKVDLNIENTDNDKLKVNDVTSHTDNSTAFKETIKVDKTLEVANSKASSSTSSGGSAGGFSSGKASSTLSKSNKKAVKLLEDDEKEIPSKTDAPQSFKESIKVTEALDVADSKISSSTTSGSSTGGFSSGKTLKTGDSVSDKSEVKLLEDDDPEKSKNDMKRNKPIRKFFERIFSPNVSHTPTNTSESSKTPDEAENDRDSR